MLSSSSFKFVDIPWGMKNILKVKGKIKQYHYRPGQALRVPGGWGSRFQDCRLMTVVRSVLRNGRLPPPPQEIFLVLICVRGWVDPSATVRLKGLCQRKIPMKPSGIKPATFRFVAQCLIQQRQRVPSQRTSYMGGRVRPSVGYLRLKLLSYFYEIRWGEFYENRENPVCCFWFS
jgi:hypothetical protein